MKKHWLLLLGLIASLGFSAVQAETEFDPTLQGQNLFYDEAQAVYLGNLARRDNGVPPLRWNQELTLAGRWFAWDSVENRPGGYCGHQDTQGNWPGFRAQTYGYLGGSGAENAYCGYMVPAAAIEGWMNSPGHRANLLDPGSREIGLGYYRRDSDGRGYVVQDFGNDPAYAPVIIENEAIYTTTPAVNLYVYDHSSGGGFAGLGPAVEMQISNEACFSGASWEPYSATRAWNLAPGAAGWRNVYAKTRDIFGRSLSASDSIFLYPPLAWNDLDASALSTTQPSVTIYNLNGGGLNQVQFSPGWLADDSYGSFGFLWGAGERVSDPAAWGGTAYRLYPGGGYGESSAWVYDTGFIKDAPMTAYVRLKVKDNTTSSAAARFSIQGGGTEYGPLTLKGTDFSAANQYQEFALNFTFNTNPNDVFLIFQFWSIGNAEVTVDAVSIFSAPQPLSSPLTWSVPGGNYRGQGIWVRYTNGSQFSGRADGQTVPFVLAVAPAEVTLLASQGGNPPEAVLAVTRQCGSFNWQVNDDAAWLETQVSGSTVHVSTNPAGLGSGVYTGTVTISAAGAEPVTSQVRLIVADEVFPVFVPVVRN